MLFEELAEVLFRPPQRDGFSAGGGCLRHLEIPPSQLQELGLVSLSIGSAASGSMIFMSASPPVAANSAADAGWSEIQQVQVREQFRARAIGRVTLQLLFELVGLLDRLLPVLQLLRLCLNVLQRRRFTDGRCSVALPLAFPAPLRVARGGHAVDFTGQCRQRRDGGVLLLVTLRAGIGLGVTGRSSRPLRRAIAGGPTGIPLHDPVADLSPRRVPPCSRPCHATRTRTPSRKAA